MNANDVISELRSALARPRPEVNWRWWRTKHDEAIWELIEDAHASDPARCAEIVGPFLEGTARASTREPFLILPGVRALERVHALAPSADLGLTTSSVEGLNGKVAAEALTSSAAIGSLTHLVVEAQLGPKGAATLFGCEALRRLVSLSVRNNDLRTKGIRELARASHLARVGSLDVSNNRLGQPALTLLQEIEHLEGVRVLDVSWNSFGSGLLPTIEARGAYARLNTLHMRYTTIEESEARSLWRHPVVETLDALDLRTNWLEDRWLEDGGPLSLAKLTRLDLSGNHITARGLSLLAQHDLAGTLRDLSANMCRDVRAEGLEGLASSELLSGLRRLDLSSCVRLGDDGVEALVAPDRLSGIEELDLSQCEWAARGGEALARADLSSLRVLGAQGIEVEGIAAALSNPTLTNLEELRTSRRLSQFASFELIDVVERMGHLSALERVSRVDCRGVEGARERVERLRERGIEVTTIGLSGESQ